MGRMLSTRGLALLAAAACLMAVAVQAKHPDSAVDYNNGYYTPKPCGYKDEWWNGKVETYDCKYGCDDEVCPHCGKDGHNYKSECDAYCHKTEIDYKGECKACGYKAQWWYGKEETYDCAYGCTEEECYVCGKDGHNYRNKCDAHCHKVEVEHEGKCGCKALIEEEHIECDGPLDQVLKKFVALESVITEGKDCKDEGFDDYICSIASRNAFEWGVSDLKFLNSVDTAVKKGILEGIQAFKNDTSGDATEYGYSYSPCDECSKLPSFYPKDFDVKYVKYPEEPKTFTPEYYHYPNYHPKPDDSAYYHPKPNDPAYHPKPNDPTYYPYKAQPVY